MLLIPDDSLGVVCVFQEAEGEPHEGKVAVAEVILRRTERRFMSDGTVAGEFVSVTAKSSTTFTVRISKNDGTAGTSQTIYWTALK